MTRNKSRVYWDGWFWIAAFDHGAWLETDEFDDWESAMDQALYLYLENEAWK